MTVCVCVCVYVCVADSSLRVSEEKTTKTGMKAVKVELVGYDGEEDVEDLCVEEGPQIV